MSANEYKEKANAFLKNKEFNKALEMYNKAVELAPEDKVHYSNRSACYTNLNECNKAIEDANKCIELDSKWPRGYQRKGQAQLKINLYEESIVSFKEGLKHDPENKTLKECLEEAEKLNSNPFMKNKYKLYTDPRTSKYMSDPNFINLLDYAMKDQKMLLQLVQSDPRFMDVFSVLSGIDLGKAQEDYQKESKTKEELNRKKKEEEDALKKKKDEENEIRQEKERYENLTIEEKEEEDKKKEAEEIKQKGNNYFKNKNFKEALDLYTKASELYPKEVTYFLNKASCHHELKEFDKVVEECQKVLDNTLDFQKKSKAFGRMGYAYQEKGDLNQAIKCFESSLLEFKDNRIKIALREAESRKKKKEAEEYINPEISEEANNKGNELYKKQDYVNALKEYTEAVKRNPKLAKYYSNRAAAYIKLMSLAEALNDCEKAIELDNNFLRAHQRLCNVQMMMKRYHKAMGSYEKALKLFPNDTELKEGYYKCMSKINEGGDDEERLKQTMNDPEIQSLIVDPRVQQLLKDLKENPHSANEKVMKDPFLSEAFRKLIAAGIIKTK